VIWDPFQAAAEAATGARTLADGTGIVRTISSTLFEEVHRERSKIVDLVLPSSAKSMTGPRVTSMRWRATRARDRLSVRSIEVALKRQSYGIKRLRQRDRRSAAGRDAFFALGLLPKSIKISDRHGGPHMSIDKNINANISGPADHGDGRYLGTTSGGREVNFNYLRQIAQAADQLGYFGVLLPRGRSCEDSWVSHPRSRPGPSACVIWWRCGLACNRPASPRE